VKPAELPAYRRWNGYKSFTLGTIETCPCSGNHNLISGDIKNPLKFAVKHETGVGGVHSTEEAEDNITSVREGTLLHTSLRRKRYSMIA
jgi:hypothetical protein